MEGRSGGEGQSIAAVPVRRFEPYRVVCADFVESRPACENGGLINVRDRTVRERRRCNRLNLRGKVCLDLGGQRFEFPSADISVSGVGIMLDIAVLGAKPSGEVGFCTIASPELAGPVEAYVSVMRIRRVGHQHLVGLRFESISDEQLQIIRAFEAACRTKAVSDDGAAGST
jgi:hypothetical protein